MKHAKRLIAMLLAMIMVLSMVACGRTEQPEAENNEVPEAAPNQNEVVEEAKDPVELHWWYTGNGIQKDTELVQEEFNKLLQTYEGMEHVTVVLHPEAYADFVQNVALAQTAGEKMDILQSYRLDFAGEVSNGTYIDLNEWFDEYPDLKAELPDWLWAQGSVDGGTYIVPCNQRASNQMFFITPKDYMDKYGDLEAMSKLLTDNNKDVDAVAKAFEDYYLAIKAGESGLKYMPSFGTHWGKVVDSINARGDRLLGSHLVVFENTHEVVHANTTNECYRAYEISAEWYEKGYIHPDILTINPADYSGANMLNESSYVFCFNSGAGSAEEVAAQYSTQYGFEVVAIPLFTNYYIANGWAAGGNGVTASCENPAEAVRLLELTNTEEGKDLYNMLVYGIEGVHYEKTGDNTIKTLEYDGSQGGSDCSYAAMKWIMGNTNHVYLNQGCAANEIEVAKDISENPANATSELAGLVLDSSAFQTELEQMKAVDGEYVASLRNGVLGDDLKATWDEYVAKLETAGMQKVLADIQGQLDAWYAAK